MSSSLSRQHATPTNTGYKVTVGLWRNLVAVSLSVCILFLSACAAPNNHGDKELAKNIYLELVDWHIVGLWVINCPVCWIRVNNYNSVPIKNVCFRYKTFGYNGELLTVGTYTMDGEIGPHAVKNMIEQYIGWVDLESDMLSIEIISAEEDKSHY